MDQLLDGRRPCTIRMLVRDTVPNRAGGGGLVSITYLLMDGRRPCTIRMLVRDTVPNRAGGGGLVSITYLLMDGRRPCTIRMLVRDTVRYRRAYGRSAATAAEKKMKFALSPQYRKCKESSVSGASLGVHYWTD